MKPELTNELKTRFFAPYIFCAKIEYVDPMGDTEDGKLCGVSRLMTMPKAYYANIYWNGSRLDINIEKATILLKPLSAITDEDAIEVARILYGESNDFAIEFNAAGITSVSPFGLPCYGPTVDIHWNGGLNYERADSEDYYFAYQYLQSKGYALPWYSAELKRVVSIEEQVQAGWVKLAA